MLTIGQVASRVGLRPSAIRYYESLGVLPIACRQGGKRLYDESVLERLAAIALAKAAGFELQEIRQLLTTMKRVSAGAAWRDLTRQKDAQIDREIRRLAWSKFALAKLARCTCTSVEECGRRFASALSGLPAEPPTDVSSRRKLAPKRGTHRSAATTR